MDNVDWEYNPWCSGKEYKLKEQPTGKRHETEITTSCCSSKEKELNVYIAVAAVKK